MKTFKGTFVVEVSDDVVMLLLNPTQILTGRAIKEKATASGTPDTRESIPCSITPVLLLEKGYGYGELEPVDSPKPKNLEPEPSRGDKWGNM
jgi:hypothetical protein